MTTKELPLGEQRSRLERRANVLRSRLLRTLDVLDTRRHQAQELGHHAKRLMAPAGAVVIGFVIVAGGAALGIRALVERRRERRFGYRMAKALAPFRVERRLPFWREALRRVTLSVLAVAASTLAKRGAHGLLLREGGNSGAHALPPPLTASTPQLGR